MTDEYIESRLVWARIVVRSHLIEQFWVILVVMFLVLKRK